MGITTERVSSEKAGPILQMKRSLLPIDEYAARKGLSTEIIDKFGLLGIIQTRRYKGKTFVVDTPLSPYSCISQASKEAVKPTDKTAQAKKISEPAQKIMPAAPIEKIKPDFGRVDQIPGSIQVVHTETPRPSVQSAQLTRESNRAENSFESTQIQQPDTLGIIDKPKASTNEKILTEILSEPIRPPDWEIFEGPDEFPELTETEEDVKTEERPEPVQIPQDNKVRFGPQDESKRAWQVATICLIIFFVAAVFGNVWFYEDRQVQLAKLDLLYTDIQNTHHQVTQANEEVESLKSKLAQSKTEVRQFRRELNTYSAEVKTIENELTQARQNLRTIHRVNAVAIERFNKQIEKLISMADQTE